MTEVPNVDAFRLVAQTEQLIVVHKMAGISFHTENGTPGVFEQVRAALDLDSLYPVHRLDKMTSGLLIMARDADTNRALSTLFRERRVEKYYLAISDRTPAKKQGVIKGDMIRTRRGMWKLAKRLDNPAVTQFFSVSLEPGKRLYLLRPKTGKTHQLRVALKSIGSPIIGDPLYNKASAARCDRGYLHAFAVKFTLNQQAYCFSCRPMTGELFLNSAFETACEQYADPWSLPWPAI